MNDVVHSTAEMGLNMSAVESSLRENIGLMNRLHFKDGINGLTKLVQVSERFRLNISEIASLSEKVFRPEGAIELAANLQMMGGEFARLGDPLTLMYRARNAPEELAKSIGKAAAESAIFNKETGKFEMSALELDRLRQIAEVTGMSIETLTQASKRAAQELQIQGQVGFGISDKDLSLINSFAEFDAKSGAFQVRMPTGQMVAVKDLTKTQMETLRQQKTSLEERAKQAQSFDEAFKNLIETAKATFLPLVQVLNNLISPLQGAAKWLSEFAKEYPKLGMALTATIIGAFSGGALLLKGAAISIGDFFKKKGSDLAQKITGFSGKMDKGETPSPTSKQGGFMDKLLKVNPKQLLALGGAFVLIGTGVAIAAAGLSKFVGAFKDLSPEQTEAANSALLGFGVALGAVMVGLLAFSAMAPALGIGVGVLLAFGGAVTLIGAGVGIAALGISQLVSAFGMLDPTQVASIAGSFALLSGSFLSLTAALPAIAVATLGIVGIAEATQSINTEGVNGLATSLESINNLNDDKISNLSALFNAAANSKPLMVVHTPVEVKGTITLDSGDVQMDIDMESFAPKIAKKITDTVYSQSLFQRSGSTPGA